GRVWNLHRAAGGGTLFPRLPLSRACPPDRGSPGYGDHRRRLCPASLRAVGACLGPVADPVRRRNRPANPSPRDHVRGPLRVHPHGIQLHPVHRGLYCVFRLSTSGTDVTDGFTENLIPYRGLPELPQSPELPKLKTSNHGSFGKSWQLI